MSTLVVNLPYQLAKIGPSLRRLVLCSITACSIAALVLVNIKILTVLAFQGVKRRGQGICLCNIKPQMTPYLHLSTCCTPAVHSYIYVIYLCTCAYGCVQLAHDIDEFMSIHLDTAWTFTANRKFRFITSWAIGKLFCSSCRKSTNQSVLFAFEVHAVSYANEFLIYHQLHTAVGSSQYGHMYMCTRTASSLCE